MGDGGEGGGRIDCYFFNLDFFFHPAAVSKKEREDNRFRFAIEMHNSGE